VLSYSISACQKPTDAKTVFTEFQKEMKLESPLLNFINFLLVTIQQKDVNLFKTIRENYAPTLNRDDTFIQYVDTIAKNYLGIEPPQSGASGLMKMMKAFMQGEHNK